MKRIIDWIKRWSFLLLVLIVGAGFLTVSDLWQVYAKPIEQAKEWWLVKVQTMQDVNPEELSLQEEAVDKEVEDYEVGAGASKPENNTNVGENVIVEEQDAPLTDEVITYRNPEDVVYKTVEDDYFRDAVFIGDSRTVGLFEYGGLEEIATFYASTGLTIHKLFDAPIVEVEAQKEKITVEQAISERSFSKIYLMIGINEMGTGTVDSFMETYARAVEYLRELQPEATIYLQGIMKVTTERSEKGDYITNAGIEERNARIAQLADNVNIYYLDVNPLLCDETGGMEASYTFDGVHLKAQHISIWKDYLKCHAVDQFPTDM